MKDAAVPTTVPDAPAPQWWVVCLCAGWCGVCREYRSGFEALAQAVQHSGVFGRAFAAHQRGGEALGVVHIVQPETAFHTQAVVIGRAVGTAHGHDAFA